MPLTKFVCSGCGQEFEIFLRPSEMGTAVKCPRCQSEAKESGALQPDTDEADSAGCGPSKVT